MPHRNERECGRSCTKGTAAAAGLLRVGVVEDEALGQERRVVVERGAVEEQVALAVDEDLRALRPLEHFVAKTRFTLPAERVAQPRAATALHSHAQTSDRKSTRL